MEGEEEGKVTGILRGDRADEGKNDRKGLWGAAIGKEAGRK